MEGRTWVMVADASRARIFRVSHNSLVELQDLLHPAGRLKPSDLVSDRPGLDYTASHPGSHGVTLEKDVREQELRIFARAISEILEKARIEKQFQRLYIMASSRMLGLLRKQLSQQTRTLVVQEMDLNITREEPGIIREHLPKYL